MRSRFERIALEGTLMAFTLFLAGLAMITALAPIISLWQWRLSRSIVEISPEAHTALRFNKAGAWVGWEMARARTAFRSPLMASLPPELARSVRRYVVTEVAYTWTFAATFIAFIIDSL
jgi:hypothetical protein